MIVIDIDPVLAVIGPFTFTWHGLFGALGIMFGLVVALRLARRAGISHEHIYGAALWSVPAGIVGARLLHVVDQFSFYAANPLAILTIQEGGLALYGGLVGGIFGALLYAYRHGIPLGRFVDLAAPPLILGQAIGRIGDVINGEHHGTPSDLPWSVVYSHPNTAGERGLPVHPAVGYEMIWDLVIFAMLLRLRDRLPHSGMLFWIYVALNGLGRLAVGFFRKDTMVLRGLGQAQIIAIISVVVASFVLAAFAIRRTETAGTAA